MIDDRTQSFDSPLLRLSPEDLSMVCTFVLASGSVKDLAESYSISYPTMRSRLDALIERLRRHAEGKKVDPVDDYLADLIAKGRMLPGDASKIRELHRQVVGATSQSESENHA